MQPRFYYLTELIKQCKQLVNKFETGKTSNPLLTFNTNFPSVKILSNCRYQKINNVENNELDNSLHTFSYEIKFVDKSILMGN